jgi:hypothetical protein
MEVLLLILSIVICLIILFIIYCTCRYSWNAFRSKKTFCSSPSSCAVIDTRYEANDKEATEMLNKVDKDLNNLINFMNKRYIQKVIPPARNLKQSEFNERAYLTKRMKERYHGGILEENRPNSDKETSYVVNKGDKMALCVRGAATQSEHLVAYDLLQFVAFHEVTHIATETYNHDFTFWRRFKIILTEAHDAGIYNSPIDYSKSPVNYCTLHLQHNPFFDHTL